MADTFNKKALQQKRAKKKQDKLDRKQERQSNNDKGKSLEDMIVYLDEMGNITDVPPEKQKKRKDIKVEDIQIGIATHIEEDVDLTGKVSLFVVDKNYGFIIEDNSNETVFVHGSNLLEPVTEKDKVSYKKEKTPKGFAAIEVRKIK